MSKTAQRRHQQQRHMRRRLRLPLWSWVERSPDLSDDDRAALRARAARHSVPCSCYWCRACRIETTEFKRRRAAVEVIHAADAERKSPIMHMTMSDAAVLRRHYGPAAVPTVDPTDEDYTWMEEAAPVGIPEVAPNATENIAALLADVDYWTKAIHEAAQQLRRISVHLAQMRIDKVRETTG